MTDYTKIDNDIISYLENSTPEIVNFWTEAPSVMHLPTDKERKKYYINISLFVKKEQLTRSKLLSHCLIVSKKVIASSLLNDEKGFEISVYIVEDKRSKRMIRMSPLNSSYDIFVSSSIEALSNYEECDFIKVNWQRSLTGYCIDELNEKFN